MRRKLLLAAAGLLLALLAGEGVLRAWPSLLPLRFTSRYALWGVEIHTPGALARTPLGQVPVPMPWRDYAGQQPQILLYMTGGTPFPGEPLELRIDASGFPNATVPASADVIVLGDSFAFLAGATRPPGLAAQLAAATGLSVYCVACPAIGPHEEEWLLREHALPKSPRVVLWFFFAGNDLVDAALLLERRAAGVQYLSELHPRPRPRSLLLAYLGQLPRSARPLPAPSGVPGVRLTNDGPPHWFHPRELWDLLKNADAWTVIPAFAETCEVLRRARDACDDAGAELVLVYVPSKAQTLLPYLAHEKKRVLAQAELEPPPGNKLTGLTAGEFFTRATRNADTLEALLAAFCRDEDIPFVSALPALRALAARGEAGFLSADTHWNAAGQSALVAPLVEALDGLLPP